MKYYIYLLIYFHIGINLLLSYFHSHFFSDFLLILLSLIYYFQKSFYHFHYLY